MILSIHQPQYLPWLPYFQKIDNSDLFIFLDSVDFQKNGLQNRNEIKTAQGRHWLTVPVKHNLGQKIIDTEINNNLNWKRKHWQTIRNCYCKSKFFHKYEDYFESLYASESYNLCELNIEITKKMMEWLSIETPTIRSSSIESDKTGSSYILELCINQKASVYLSGIGGKNYLDLDEFKSNGINIQFLENTLPKEYPQLFPKINFMNDLSAIDIIFNCGENWRDIVKF